MISNRHQPSWWTESRAADEAQIIEEALARRLWALETIVTAAPLLGLETVVGMMHVPSKVIGSEGVVNPTAVTGGVASSDCNCCRFNNCVGGIIRIQLFSRLQSLTMDEMERLGTRLS